jgi:transcriptional regulator with XRE-family HTH domain
MKNLNNMERIADSLRLLRENHNYEKATIANLLGLNAKEYSKLEKGSRALNLEHLCILANFYKVRKSVVLDYGSTDRPETNEAIEATLKELEVSTKWLKEIQDKIAVMQMKLDKKRSA